jgi:hypothetical protein
MKYVGGSQTGDYSIFKISRSWTEEDATWEKASKDQSWSKPGGDYVTKAIAKVTWPRSNGKSWVPYDVLSTVQEFVQNPAENFGFMIVNTKMTQEIDFVSTENTDAEHRPKLTITYDETTGALPSSASATGRDGVTFLARHRELRMFNNCIHQTVTFTIAQPDGKCVRTGYIAAGGVKLLTGLKPGVYIITMRGKNLLRSSTVTTLP